MPPSTRKRSEALCRASEQEKCPARQEVFPDSTHPRTMQKAGDVLSAADYLQIWRNNEHGKNISKMYKQGRIRRSLPLMRENSIVIRSCGHINDFSSIFNRKVPMSWNQVLSKSSCNPEEASQGKQWEHVLMVLVRKLIHWYENWFTDKFWSVRMVQHLNLCCRALARYWRETSSPKFLICWWWQLVAKQCP